MKARIIVLSALGLIVCAHSGVASERVFSGRYTVGFETSQFVPCGKDEKWWVTGDLSAINAKMKTSPGGEMQTFFVRVMGSVTPPGRYGHLGAYKRKLTVARVIRVRASRPDDCH